MSTSSNSSYMGTYERYKSNTNIFITWLARTAGICGYELDQPLQPISNGPAPNDAPKAKLKGRARKLARDAAQSSGVDSTTDNYDNDPAYLKKVAVKAVLPLAQQIANKRPTPIVQAEVFRTLRQIIADRRECALWWKSVPDAARHEKKNASHIHFIQLLERVLEVLLICASKDEGIECAQTTEKPKNVPSGFNDPVSLSNRFSVLSIEEDTGNESLEVPVVASKVSKSAPRVTYEVEDLEDDEELLIALFGQMSDLHKMSSYLEDAWQPYKQGRASLVVVSMVTNTALKLVESMNNKLHERFPQITGYWETFVGFFLGVARGARESVSNPSNMKEANLQDWILLDAYMASEQQLHYLDSRDRDEHNETLDDLHRDLREINEMALAPTSAFMEIRLSEDRLLDKFTKKATLVATNHLYIQELLWTFATCKADQAPAIGADSLLSTLGVMYSDMKRTNEMNMYWLDNTPTVFAFHIYFRIRHVLGNDAGVCCDLFKKESDLIDKLHGKEPMVQTLLSFYTPGRGCRTERSSKWGTEQDETDAELLPLLSVHPLFAGLRNAELMLWRRRMNLSEINRSARHAHLIAHLYNALRHMGLLTTKWPDMDTFISLHQKTIFIGQPHGQLDRFYSNVLMSMGMPAHALTRRRDALRNKHRTVSKMRDFAIEGSPVFNMLWSPITSVMDPRGVPFDDLEHVLRLRASKIEVAITQDDNGKLTDAPAIRKAAARKVPLGPLQILQTMEKTLHSELPYLVFDYPGLEERSKQLLLKLRAAFDCIWDILDELGWCTGPRVDTYNTFHIVEILLYSPVTLEPAKKIMGKRGGALEWSVLQETADIMESWLAENGAVAVGALQNEVPGYLVPAPPSMTSNMEDRVPWARDVVAGVSDDKTTPDVVHREAVKHAKTAVQANSIKALSEADREAMVKVVRAQQQKARKRGR